jgi:hypothetical protein
MFYAGLPNILIHFCYIYALFKNNVEIKMQPIKVAFSASYKKRLH